MHRGQDDGFRLGKFLDLKADLGRVLDHSVSSSSFAEQLHHRAEMESDLQRYREAKSLAEQAIASDPTYGYGYSSLARALLGLELYRESEKAIRRAIELEPNNAYFHRVLAVSLRTQRKLRAARKAIDQSLSLGVGDFHSHAESGRIFHAVKKYKESIDCFEKSLSMSPICTSTLDGLGDVYLEMGRNVDAEQIYRQSLKWDANNARALNNLGVSLQRQKKLKDAAMAYKAAVLVDPNLKVAKSNTKKVIDTLLSPVGIPIGVVAFISILQFARLAASGTHPWILFPLIGISIILVGCVIFWNYRKRRQHLETVDPELLEIYQKIKKFG